jgi:hypothetical protein
MSLYLCIEEHMHSTSICAQEIRNEVVKLKMVQWHTINKLNTTILKEPGIKYCIATSCGLDD